jgi:hypothetical protein
MTGSDDRRIAFILGVLGAVLLLLAAVLHFAVGVGLLITGATRSATGSLGSSVVEVVVALLIGFFAFLGRARGSDRNIAAGIVLVVLAVVGWAALGFGADLLALLASILTLLSGVLFLLAGR